MPYTNVIAAANLVDRCQEPLLSCRLRVLFIHSINDLYGASRSLLRMVTRLCRDGNDVTALLPSEGELARRCRAAGARVIVDPELARISRQEFRHWKKLGRFPLRFLRSSTRLARLVAQHRPDLIHSNTALIPISGVVGRWRRVPHIVHVREIFSEFGSLWKLYQWFLYFFSDIIICNSNASAMQFHPRIRKTKVRVIYNGYPLDEYEPVPPDRTNDLRKLYGLNDCVVVGMVGRIRLGRKGQDVFLKAASILHDKFPEVKFVCIGSPFPGNEFHLQQTEMLIADLGLTGVAICTGDVRDIKAAYAVLDISVQASVLPESFGGVALESMAMGKPVIATAIGGALELIEHNISGILVPPNDPLSLAQAIERLLCDPSLRDGLGKAGRRRYLQKFEFESFYSQLMDVYSAISHADTRATI